MCGASLPGPDVVNDAGVIVGQQEAVSEVENVGGPAVDLQRWLEKPGDEVFGNTRTRFRDPHHAITAAQALLRRTMQRDEE